MAAMEAAIGAWLASALKGMDLYMSHAQASHRSTSGTQPATTTDGQQTGSPLSQRLNTTASIWGAGKLV